MFAIPGFILGAIVGWFRAGALKGSMLDRLQYSAVYGIVFFLIALVVTIALDLSGVV